MKCKMRLFRLRLECALLATATLLFAGCTQPVSIERQRAVERWSDARNDILMELAVEAYENGALQTAEAKLVQMLENGPDRERPKFLLARIYVEMNRLDEANQFLSELLAMGCQDAEVHFLRGVICETHREYTIAARHYARAVRIKPGFLPYTAATAEALLSADKPDAAQTFLDTVESLHRVTPEWLALRAEAASVARDYPRAAEFYKQALTLSEATTLGGDPVVARRLADVYRLMERNEDAARLLNQLNAESIQPTPDVDAALASTYLAMGRASDATHVLDRLNDSDASPLWIDVARQHVDNQRWQAAQSAVDKALRANPTNADALMISTLISIRSGRADEADRTLAQWRKAHPDDPMIDTMQATLHEDDQLQR